MTDDKGKLRKINAPRLTAPKERGDGEIEYELLDDADGCLHVRMLGNTRDGDFSGSAFPLASLIEALDHGKSEFTGRDEEGMFGVAKNRNNKAFLRAIVRQLLPGLV